MDDKVADGLLRVLDSQERYNDGTLRALEALALQAERYDSELAEIREGLATIHMRLTKLDTAFETLFQYPEPVASRAAPDACALPDGRGRLCERPRGHKGWHSAGTEWWENA